MNSVSVPQFLMPHLVCIPVLVGLLSWLFLRKTKFVVILNLLSSIFLVISSVMLMSLISKNGAPVIYNLGAFNSKIGIAFKADYFSAFGVFFVSLSHFINSSLQVSAISLNPPSAIRLGLGSMLIAGLNGIIITDDIFNSYVFIEIISIASCILAISKWNEKSYIASFRYLIISSVAGCMILFGIGLLYANFGSLNITELRAQIGMLAQHNDLVIYSFMFILVGFLVKTAAYPFHKWYLGVFKTATPSTLSLFSYSGSQVAILVLVKFIYSLYGVQFSMSYMRYFYSLMVLISITSILFGSIKAIFAKSMIEVLACSSISQTGFVILAFISDNQIVVSGAMMQMLGNAISKIVIFRVYQHMIARAKLNSLIKVEEIGRFDFSGVRIPIMLNLINLAGLPLSIGFMAKIYMTIGFVSEVKIGSFLAIIASSVLSIIYIFRIIEGVIIGNKPGVDTEIKFYKLKIPIYERTIYAVVAFCVVASPFLKPFNRYLKSASSYITDL